jgi:hypothetical protein
MQTYQHRADMDAAANRCGFFPITNPADATLTMGSQQPASPSQVEEQSASVAPSPVEPFMTIWNVTLEARWINEDIGYGMFALTDTPDATYITSYEGHRRDPTTGQILMECPHTLEVEQSFRNHYSRSDEWGQFQKSHCVLVERISSSNVCIDGVLAACLFLFSEPFHASLGFGSVFNAGANSMVSNITCVWRDDPMYPGDVLHKACTV